METTPLLRVDALPRDDLDRIRRQGMDDFGNPLVVTVAREPEPLRCCLREAIPGERIALIAYQPSRRGGPYAEVGPVFIHAEACEGYTTPDRYPDEFRPRRQVVRAYSDDGRIVDAVMVEDGDAAEKAYATFFTRPEIAYIHSRNVLYGCYMFTVRRPGDDQHAMR